MMTLILVRKDLRIISCSNKQHSNIFLKVLITAAKKQIHSSTPHNRSKKENHSSTLENSSLKKY